MLTKFVLVLTTGGMLLVAGCSSVVRDRSTLRTLPNDAETSAGDELDSSAYDTLQFATDLDDSLARQMMEDIRLADEYYAYGVQANVAQQWLEAQYNFERAISILSELSIAPDDRGAVGYSYAKLQNEIRSEYKLTLLYLATIPGETSSSAFVDRFDEIDDFGKLKDEKVVVTVDNKVNYDIPMVMNDKVENCIIYFQTIARDFFQAALTRSGKYTKLMARILEEENVPKDLVYLPLIESGFKTNAYSWASAVGPWQFISSTGRRFGMDRDYWFDERRDFEKSTRAAARYLKFLYDRYGDWYLALAAYNCGEGKVDQSIQRDGTTDYWKLSRIKRETKDYVPLYLAATIMAKNPEKYGFVAFYDDPLEYETVTVKKPLDLYEVAKSLGTTYDYLKSLNPELLRKLTHPIKENYTLRIPPNQSTRFWAAYDQFTSARSTTLMHHEIKKGETLSSIAKSYQISVQALADANNLKKKQGLTEGRTILIPVPSAARTVRERQPIRRKTFDEPEKSSNQTYAQRRSKTKTTKVTTYKVREGDTIERLAKAHDVSVAQLVLLNGLEGNRRLRTGQLLNVPISKPQQVKAKSGGGLLVYVVRAGDTLWDIAKAFSCSVDDIIRLNNLRSHRLNVGDRLRVGAN